MKQNTVELYADLERAIDRAVWLQFENRNARKQFVVYDGPADNYAVSDLATAKEMEMDSHFYPLPESYKNLSYEKLETIAKDSNILEHWEKLLGEFCVMESELLRFIIQSQIPVEKIIRRELASRGFDQNDQWVGFEVSKEIWQNDN